MNPPSNGLRQQLRHYQLCVAEVGLMVTGMTEYTRTSDNYVVVSFMKRYFRGVVEYGSKGWKSSAEEQERNNITNFERCTGALALAVRDSRSYHRTFSLLLHRVHWLAKRIAAAAPRAAFPDFKLQHAVRNTLSAIPPRSSSSLYCLHPRNQRNQCPPPLSPPQPRRLRLPSPLTVPCQHPYHRRALSRSLHQRMHPIYIFLPMCNECGDDHCEVCLAAQHRKGSRKKHAVTWHRPSTAWAKPQNSKPDEVTRVFRTV